MGIIQDLKGIKSFIDTVENNREKSFSDVVLESAGLRIPLPNENEVSTFYESIGDPNNTLTTIPPQEWSNAQYLEYQADVRKARVDNKFTKIKDAKKLQQAKAQEKIQKTKNKFKFDLGKQDAEKIEEAIPEDLKPKGFQKTPGLLNKVLVATASLTLPAIFNMVRELGLDEFDSRKQEAFDKLGIDEKIQEISEITSPEKLEELRQELCPTPDTLEKIIRQRNGIVETINNQQVKVESLKQMVDVAGDLATGLDNIKLAAEITSQISEGVKRLAPTVTVYNIFDKVQTIADQIKNVITFQRDGEPRLPPLRKTVSNASIPLNQVNNLTVRLLNILGRFDEIILLCAPNSQLEAFSEDVMTTYITQTVANITENQSTYKGFILEIETRPFSDTVDQNRAVGKNNDGIILISTNYSFASDPNVLIEELKFIIDRDDLKAY